MKDAIAEARSFLQYAEEGYKGHLGSVPLETRIELAKIWLEVARVEALGGNDHE